MIIHTMWVMWLWISIWRLTMYAGTTNNIWLLGFAMFMSHMMCIHWYPIFKNKEDG